MFGLNSYVYGILVMVNIVITFIGEDCGVVSRSDCDYYFCRFGEVPKVWVLIS